MFMDRKTQYCQGVSFSQLDLQIQHNTNQNSKLFCGYWHTDFKVYMKMQKTQNNQLSTEGEEQS